MQISPGKNDNLHLVTATSTAQGPGSIGLSLVWQSRPPMYGLICGFCSSARNFAHWRTFQPPQSGFLQIPPRDGHPCLRLTVPATESVVDFHHQVVAHAGRTNKSVAVSLAAALFLPASVLKWFPAFAANGARYATHSCSDACRPNMPLLT